MVHLVKKHLLWVFLDIGNPFSQTWEGRFIYRVSKWLVEHVDSKAYFGEDDAKS